MRLSIVVFVPLLFACRSQTDASSVAPLSSSTPSSSPTAAPASKRVCEPMTGCGSWSRCTWLVLDHVDHGREIYRTEDGAVSQSRYSRAHRCSPADAGRAGCSVYCDAAGVCVDGLESDALCTRAGPPRPSPFVCEVRGGACTTR